MSAPAEKSAPAPVSTSTLSAGSASTSATIPGTADHISCVIAFFFSGRVKVSLPTAPSRVNSRLIRAL